MRMHEFAACLEFPSPRSSSCIGQLVKSLINYYSYYLAIKELVLNI